MGPRFWDRGRGLRGLVAAGMLLGFLVPALVAAQSQSTGGTIEGSVKDDSGAPLPGVTVAIRNLATSLSRSTVTDGSGLFRAPLLPVGTYELEASLSGFASLKSSDLRVGIGQTLTVDLKMQLAAVSESITVTGEASVLEVTRSAQASAVGAEAVAALPTNGRNFIDFVLTTPGVTRDVRLGDISFAGQRGTLNSLVVDGADNNNTFFGQTLGRTGSGRAPYQFSQDAVQEFQVNRNAYSAEYGRAGGAVINVVTKSGGNELKGSAFEFYRSEDLNAKQYADKIANRAKSKYRYDQFGLSLGGPVVHDRLFFFLSYDAQRNTIPNVISIDNNLAGLTLPNDPETIAGLAKLRAKGESWERGQDQDVYLAKLDWLPSSSHRLSARYNRQEFTGVNFENGGATNGAEHTGDSLVNTDTINASLSSVFSDALFNELRGQWAKDQEPGKANSDLPEATVRQGGRTILVVGRNFFSPRETTIDRWQVADTVSWFKGSHGIKAGFDYLHDDILNYFPGNFSGGYTFDSLAAWNLGVPSSYVQAFAGAGTTGPTTKPSSRELAAFVQDEWKISSQLSVMLGVRYDLQKYDPSKVRNPDPQLAAAGIDTRFVPKDDDNYAPRLGFAWTPRSDVVVRGGYGVFYGRTPAIMVGTAHSNNGINVQTITLTGSAVPTYPTILTSIPTGATPPKPSIFVFDPAFENPEVAQASLGADWAITPDWALAVSYLHVDADHLQRTRDFNVGTPVATEIPVTTGGSVTVQRFPSARPFSNFDRILRFESTAESRYDGATIELRRRFVHGFQASVAYTYGKVEDTVPDATAVVPGGSDDAKFASNPADFEADRAPGANDQRHRVVVSGLWQLPYFRESDGWRRAVLGGWSISWIASYQSGQPYSLAVTNDLNNDGNRRNDIVPGSRDSVELPATYGVDLRISKEIRLGGRVGLELIAEAFNLFDRDNITGQRTGYYTYNASANTLAPQSNFGQDTTAADNRIVQLAAKITF